MATELITLIQLGTYLGRVLAEESREDLVRLWINTAVESYCGREFGADAADRAEVHTIEDDYADKIIVFKPPIISLTSVESGRTTWSAVDSSSYVYDASSGIIRKVTGWWTRGVAYYRVNYKGGFAALPADVVGVALSIAARECEKASKGRFGMRARGFQGGSGDYFTEQLEALEKEILDHYSLKRLDA